MVLRSPLFYSKIGFGLVCSGRLVKLCCVELSCVTFWRVSCVKLSYGKVWQVCWVKSCHVEFCSGRLRFGRCVEASWVGLSFV